MSVADWTRFPNFPKVVTSLSRIFPKTDLRMLYEETTSYSGTDRVFMYLYENR
jgi:hypothetical protein